MYHFGILVTATLLRHVAPILKVKYSKISARTKHLVKKWNLYTVPHLVQNLVCKKINASHTLKYIHKWHSGCIKSVAKFEALEAAAGSGLLFWHDLLQSTHLCHYSMSKQELLFLLQPFKARDILPVDNLSIETIWSNITNTTA